MQSTNSLITSKRNADNLRNAMLKEAIVAFLGGKCARCGETDIRVLTLDHKNNDGKLDRYRGTHGIRRDILKGLRNKDDFQILCANCHLIKTHWE